jgi:hypothetical protein
MARAEKYLLTHTLKRLTVPRVNYNGQPNEASRYAAALGRRGAGRKKRITKADARSRSLRLAAARAALTPEAIARRTATRLANMAARKRAR